MGKASRRKRRRAAIDPTTPEGRLAGRLVQRYDTLAIRNPSKQQPGVPALSERISTLIDPYQGGATTLTAYHALTTIAVLAWNLSFQPEQEHELAISKAIRRTKMHDPETFRGLVQTLIARKRELFPEDRRLIAGHEVTPTNEGFHLVVASMNVDVS